MTVPESTVVLTLKTTILPGFFALAMLLVLGPRAIVHSLVSSHELANSVSLVIFPRTRERAAIRVDHATVAILFVIHPVPIITHAIRPDLPASSMLLRSNPLALVNSFILHYDFVPRHGLLIEIRQ